LVDRKTEARWRGEKGRRIGREEILEDAADEK